MPVDYLLGNDLKHSVRKEVALKSHSTRSMAIQENSQGSLEPRKMARQLLNTGRAKGVGNQPI